MKLHLSVLSLVMEHLQLFGVEQLLSIALMIELPYVIVSLISLDMVSVRPAGTPDQ